VLISLLLAAPFRAAGNPDATDWRSFAGAARIVAEGQSHHLFDPDAAVQYAHQAALVESPQATLDVYPNPPLLAALLIPVASLPYRTGMLVFIVLMMICLALCTLLMARLLPRSTPVVLATTAIVLTLMPDALHGVLFAQPIPLLTLSVVGATILLARGGDSVWIGLLLSVCGIKPQYLWLLPFGLIVTRHWRILVGLGIGSAVWAASTVMLLGVAGTVTWLTKFLPLHYGPQLDVISGITGLLTWLHLPPSLAVEVALLSAVVALAAVWRYRTSLAEDPALLVSLLVVVGLLCSPHVFEADVAIVGVLMAVLISRGWAKPVLVLAYGSSVAVTLLTLTTLLVPLLSLAALLTVGLAFVHLERSRTLVGAVE
jgi:hypothetical protein